MKCQNFKCRKEIRDGTKKCPYCGWEQRDKQQTKAAVPTITLTISRPQKDANGDFTISAYAVARHLDGNLVGAGQQVIFHTDDLVEFVELTGVRELGRADHIFTIPASRAGENVIITVHTQIGNQRFEATKTVQLPKEKEKSPIKTATDADFFETFKKYKGDKG
jgi:hypothetical protein